MEQYKEAYGGLEKLLDIRINPMGGRKFDVPEMAVELILATEKGGVKHVKIRMNFCDAYTVGKALLDRANLYDHHTPRLKLAPEEGTKDA